MVIQRGVDCLGVIDCMHVLCLQLCQSVVIYVSLG